MPSTHTSLHAHLVFSTKDREPLITTNIRARLHEYLGGCFRGLDLLPLEIGGVQDHVHNLIAYKPTHRLADVLRDVKRATTKFCREELGINRFQWQEGYGAFGVNRSSVDAVRRYIQNQEEHHRTKTFQEEYLEFLKMNHVEFDPRYLW